MVLSFDLAVPCSTEWSEFHRITLPVLADIVVQPSSSKGDVMSPCLFKQIFASVGTSVQGFFYSSHTQVYII